MRYSLSIILHLVSILLGVAVLAFSLPLTSTPEQLQHNLAFGGLMYVSGAVSVALYFIATGMLHEQMEADKKPKPEKVVAVPAEAKP